MSKLYPPIIGDKIPGFYNTVKIDEKFYARISVPFENNRSVSPSEVSTIILRLKTIQTDKLVIEERSSDGDVPDIMTGTKVVHFLIDTEKLNIGQFYKIQIAYVKNYEPGEEWEAYIGYYSNVGIAKFTSEPTIDIEGLGEGSTNNRPYNFIGNYTQESIDPETGVADILDTTEKVYQYKFIIAQGNNTIVDSGWLIHNANTDINEYKSYDEWEYLKELSNGSYTVQYKVLTNSGIEFSSPLYDISVSGSTSSAITVTPKLNFDNGYIDIFVETGSSAADAYVIRKNEDTGDIVNLGPVIDTIAVDNRIFRDFTFEQGNHYSYAVWTKTNNAYTRYNYCNPIYADYEHIFLYDGERQLKVEYNPQVSGIHETILENKIDTLGGRYPIFFRNGDVRYRDFTINGLISFQMDENRLFSEYGVADQPSRERTYTTAVEDQQTGRLHSFVLPTDLVGENFYHERMFREDVLAWLNDGKLKLFRSPSEGIMIIRIMNVNMTPEQIPSRMIYNFSCQAYEATGHEYEDLVKAKIINRD